MNKYEVIKMAKDFIESMNMNISQTKTFILFLDKLLEYIDNTKEDDLK